MNFEDPIEKGVIFYSASSEGSQVFPHVEQYLELCVCDGCLLKIQPMLHTCETKSHSTTDVVRGFPLGVKNAS